MHFTIIMVILCVVSTRKFSIFFYILSYTAYYRCTKVTLGIKSGSQAEMMME